MGDPDYRNGNVTKENATSTNKINKSNRLQVKVD